MKLEFYSDVFKNLLLRNVNVKCNSKILRSGIIKNFAIKQFIIKVFIENSKGHIRILELPYPFEIKQQNNITLLNYKLNTFCKTNSELSCKIKLLNKKNVSKFFDNIVEITVI